MSGEGERGPVPAGNWRLRLSAGLLALAALGAAVHGGTAAPAARTTAARAVRPSPEDPASILWVTEVGAVAALGKAVRRRRGADPAEGEPLEPAEPTGPHPADLFEHTPGPGPARELLALFARPQPELDRGEDTPTKPQAHLPAPAAAAAGARAGELPPLLRLYGPLSIEGANESALRRRAIRGLIAYLTLRRGPVSFEDLIDVLWPGDDPAKARMRLFKAKQHAQGVVGAALERRGGGYLLDLARVRVDVVEIERLARQGSDRDALERAVALSSGAPLADVDYPFADGERRRMVAIRFDLLARVARARLRAHEARSALDAAEELIALDTLNELGWRIALEAEGALGARRAIVERYELLAAELDCRLGLRPSAETRETYLRLLGPA